MADRLVLVRLTMRQSVCLVGLLGLLAALPGGGGEPQSRPSKSPPVKSYSTHFKLDEDPISENGNWINGAKEGLDWYNVITRNVGNVIKGYLNGVEVMTATDKTYATGNPRIGFNYGMGSAIALGPKITTLLILALARLCFRDAKVNARKRCSSAQHGQTVLCH